MMQKRRALTIPFVVDKRNLVEDPLKIPMTCLPPECGKLGQVSWTAFAGCQFRSRNSQQKNGSTVFHNSRATMITLEMDRRKPLLILTDVLKTEMGKAHMERIRKSRRKQGSQKDSRPSREEPAACRGKKASQSESRDNCSSGRRSNQRTTPSLSQRSKSRRKLSNVEDKEDIKEMVIGTESSFSEVVDCGVSLSWKSNKKAEDCDELSPDGIKVRRTNQKKDSPQKLKRKCAETNAQCNGVRSSKRHRLQTEENQDEGESPPMSAGPDRAEEDLDLDSCIMKFTVGGDDQTQTLVPFIETSLKNDDAARSPGRRSSVRQDRGSPASPFEPIVLSSDDEAGDDGLKGRAKVTAEVSDMQSDASQEALCEEDPDTQMTEAAEASPDSPLETLVFEEDCAGMSVAFWSLRCGGYRGNANGAFMITKDQIIIPLKDASGQRQVVLMFERKELRRYSIWEQFELKERGLHFVCDGADSPAVLLICVSQTAAAAIQQNLFQLHRTEDGDEDTGKACPFLFLGLKDPLLGMEGALLRSFLDIDCIKSLTHHRRSNTEESTDFEDAPVLSLDESLELIQRSGLDVDLLLMQGATRTSLELNDDQNSLHSDADELPTAHIWLDTKESEPETPPEEEAEIQAEPKTEEVEEELQSPPDDPKKDATPAYTLRHQRTKGSYSVSLCKPRSNWIPYKHQGVARRLIQFPPPPLKGGITVTMEDLQCLDTGKYLNDVIIDFYLKYLLLNTPAALSERCHVFSSFFYKQLTRRDNASEGSNSDACQRQRRHQRVKTWTRHVDIFKKDFLFVPVNQEAHWYLVVICFPGLDEPKVEPWTAGSHGEEKAGRCKRSEADAEMNRSKSVETEADNTPKEPSKNSPTSPVNCTEQTCSRESVQRRPCILLMDSLKISLHERVVKLLRDYLQSEWEVRRGSQRDFGPDQMKSSNCKVPLQDNSSDCGLYLLQYVEYFLKDPVVHFDLPLQLQQWFPRQQVRRKRDEIRDLILNLYRHQQLDKEKS
ncbi:Sentrin-specific protease 7 [Oryzias melastigma]|uniref:Sentrin-specific protease 7 n=1 Tax=Oryzias melastigma TaxID=30732 RepID=A0A834C2B9_ORYME|nr:Sentrin-specific protease 7 [Oryzias melastigma]